MKITFQPFNFLETVVIPLLTTSEQALSFGVQSIDRTFPGFKPGDLAVLYGHSFWKTLIFRLCVKCQLSREKGGFNSSIIFLDGGNTFNPFLISAVAREFGLNPKSTLERMFVSRAFTAYQLSALVLETLEDALKHYRSKLVLISEITSLFLDRDVPSKEALAIFNKMMFHLADLATRQNIIVTATCSKGERSKRLVFLESILLGKASTIARVTESRGTLQLTVQNHCFPESVAIDISHNELTLEKFVKA